MARVCGSKANITSSFINLVLYYLILMGQRHTLAALFLRKEPPVPIQQEFGGSQSQFWRKKSVLVVCRFEYLSMYLSVGYRKQLAAILFSARIWLLYVASHCVIQYPSLTKLSLFAPWSGSELIFLNLGNGWSKWPDSRPDEAPDTHVERWVGRSLGLGALEQR